MAKKKFLSKNIFLCHKQLEVKMKNGVAYKKTCTPK